jgi:hypothetical protein
MMNHLIFLRPFVPWAKLFYRIFKPIGIRHGLQIRSQVRACAKNSIYGTTQSFLTTLISY